MTSSGKANLFKRRRGQDLLEVSYPPLSQRGLLVVDDRDRMQSAAPMEDRIGEGRNQRLQYGLQDLILEQPGSCGIGLLPSVAQLVKDSSHPTATVEALQDLDLTEERVDRVTHSAAAICTQDHVGRGHEPVPSFPTERVRAGTAKPGRQASQPLVRAQTQTRGVHESPDEDIENPAEHETGLVGQMDPGAAVYRTGRAQKPGKARSAVGAEQVRGFVFVGVLPGCAAKGADALRRRVDVQSDAGVCDDLGISSREVATFPTRFVAGNLKRIFG